MFTGIVEEVGRVTQAKSGSLVISVGKVLPGVGLGRSIAVNGVCLTVTSFNSESFSVDVMPETLKRTNLGRLTTGDKVNLERPLTLGGQLGGHLVQGHVDNIGRLTKVTRDRGAMVMEFEAPPEVMPYIVEKGFIAVDGVSLTVVARDTGSFRVSIVEFTRQHTNLGSRRVGDLVNLEVDIIAKYVEQLVPAYRPGITTQFLQKHGFLVT